MLHKATYVLGFHILASDGEIGHVDDLLFDENLDDSLSRRRHQQLDRRQVGPDSVLTPSRTSTRPTSRFSVSLSREAIKASASAETAPIELIETLPPAII